MTQLPFYNKEFPKWPPRSIKKTVTSLDPLAEDLLNVGMGDGRDDSGCSATTQRSGSLRMRRFTTLGLIPLIKHSMQILTNGVFVERQAMLSEERSV